MSLILLMVSSICFRYKFSIPKIWYARKYRIYIIRNKRIKACLLPFASNYSSVVREFSNGLWKLLEGSWKHNHRPFCGDLQVRIRISTMAYNITALWEISGYIILLHLLLQQSYDSGFWKWTQGAWNLVAPTSSWVLLLEMSTASSLGLMKSNFLMSAPFNQVKNWWCESGCEQSDKHEIRSANVIRQCSSFHFTEITF